MSGHSLEEERRSILQRMQKSREDYRRILQKQPIAYTDGRAFPRSSTMRWVAQHPFLCAAAVAAVLVIGPRRIVRAAVKGSASATALTIRNPSRIEALGRLISVAASYAQRISSRRQRH